MSASLTGLTWKRNGTKIMILCNITVEDTARQNVLLDKLNKLGFYSVKVTKQELDLDLIVKAKNIGAELIICSNIETLANIVPAGEGVNLDDWRGSVFFFSVPVLIINPLIHTHTINAGDFILDCDIAKVGKILSNDYKQWQYDYCLCDNSNDLIEAADYLIKADCLVADIETTRTNLISDISFTPIINSKVGRTYQIQLLVENYATQEEWELAWTTMTHLLEAPMVKAFHNGVFDVYQLTRFQVTVRNYLLDTEYMWWSWYAEIRKSLANVASLTLPDYQYWKKSVDSDPRGYNAKDTINTARILLHMMEHMPLWARQNYAKTFPNAYPAIYMQFEGFKVDVEMKDALYDKAKATSEELLADLRKVTGSTAFNPGSHQQVSFFLYNIFGGTKPKRAKSASATDAVSMARVALQHPLLARFIEAILKYRAETKSFTTYYGAELLNGRLHYGVQIDGTETARFSSNKSHLWIPNPSGIKKNDDNYGAQIQNQPWYMKRVLIADDGFELFDVDKSQSEARCTAAISGDEELYNDLYRKPTPAEIAEYGGDAEAAGDFYCRCTYRYFGLHINKEDPKRKITKKINHGTNYMMAELTFIDSVGVLKMQEAKQILHRPVHETIKKFAGYCLSLYHTSYKGVKPWWQSIKVFIRKHGYYDTPDGWRRIFFGNIENKHAIWRSAVAHGPQHFSVAGINKAIYRLYYNVQIPSNGEYRLKCQVHDSITGQYVKEKRDYYMQKTIEVMDIPQPVRPGLDLRIPLDAAVGPSWKAMEPWTLPSSETTNEES